MDVGGSTSDSVMIRLSGDEALVRSDALATWESDGELERFTATNRAVRRVLSDLTAALEPAVDEAFEVDYAGRVRRAQSGVLGG
jgi:hypothetical protein